MHQRSRPCHIGANTVLKAASIGPKSLRCNGFGASVDLGSRPRCMSAVLHWIDGTELVTKKQCRKQFRRSILEAWDWRCAYCDCSVLNAATLDHIVAQANGGVTAKKNLVACCQRCNGSKGSSNVWEWFRAQSFFCAKREAAIWRWHFMGHLSMGEALLFAAGPSVHGLESRA